MSHLRSDTGFQPLLDLGDGARGLAPLAHFAAHPHDELRTGSAHLLDCPGAWTTPAEGVTAASNSNEQVPTCRDEFIEIPQEPRESCARQHWAEHRFIKHRRRKAGPRSPAATNGCAMKRALI
jgi:hypothetical protein